MSAPSVELSPEERCERVRMALAEIVPAFTDDWLKLDRRHLQPDPDRLPLLLDKRVSDEAIWRAFAVTGEAGSCWTCFSAADGSGYDCSHDPMTSPWPPVPSPEEASGDR